MQIDEYMEEAVTTAIYGAGSKIIYPALGLGNEAGEVQGKVKKILRDNDGNFDDNARKEIGKEIGDVMWYIAALCRDLGLSLDSICQGNIAKLKDRRERGVLQGSGDNR